MKIVAATLEYEKECEDYSFWFAKQLVLINIATAAVTILEIIEIRFPIAIVPIAAVIALHTITSAMAAELW